MHNHISPQQPDLKKKIDCAFTALKKGRFSEAYSRFSSLLDYNSEHYYVRYGLGMTFLSVAAFDTSQPSDQRAALKLAILHLTKSVDLKPSARTFNDLGCAYLALGRNNKATESFQKAVALKPSAEYIRENLRLALEAA